MNDAAAEHTRIRQECNLHGTGFRKKLLPFPFPAEITVVDIFFRFRLVFSSLHDIFP